MQRIVSFPCNIYQRIIHSFEEFYSILDSNYSEINLPWTNEFVMLIRLYSFCCMCHKQRVSVLEACWPHLLKAFPDAFFRDEGKEMIE